MSRVDPNMTIIINLLNKEKIFYWVGQGSLLGIHRNNKLIEWDHDIDICVWEDKNNKKGMIKLLEKSGFKHRAGLEGKENNEFMVFDKKGGRRVDINLYKKGKTREGQEIAFCKWVMPKNIFMKLIDAISNADNYNSKLKIIVNNLVLLKPIANLLKKSLIEKNFFYKFAGYQLPLNLLKNFKIINFYNLEITIPLYTEKYLEYLYGKDWKTPKKNFAWWKVNNIKLNFD